MTICEEYNQLFSGTNKYNCETCFHKFTCENAWDNTMCCGYWYNPESKLQGIAYDHQKKEDEMPLFA